MAQGKLKCRNGNRVKSVLNGVTTDDVGAHFAWTGDTTSMVTTSMVKYYYAGGQRMAMRKGSSTLYFLLGDHLGSTSITANSSGGKVAEFRYHPWGGTRHTDGTTPTARRYTGQIDDAAIGLYFYNARYYDGALGRFIQADSIVPSPANPQSLNRYAYCLNNPLRYTDPSGHSVLGALAIAGAIGFVADVAWQVYSNMANDNMAFTDALISVDLAEAGGAAVGAVVAAGTTMLAVAAVPIAVTGLGLSGGAASAATVGLTSLAYSGSSVVGAMASDSTAAGLRGEEYRVESLSQYRTNALVGGLIGFAVGGTNQITSIANAGVEASAREFDRTFGIVWDSYPNHNLANWSDPFVFETHIRPTLLGQVRPPSIPGLTFLQGISSSPILTSRTMAH